MTEKGLMVPNEDYVVVPLQVRDRIMQRLRFAEERLTKFEMLVMMVDGMAFIGLGGGFALSACKNIRRVIAESKETR